MKKQAIESSFAPSAIGTYSQGISAGGTIWLSGQLPLHPATGQLLTGDMREQVRQVFRNLQAVAEAGGSSLAEAVKVNVFLTDLANFGIVNEVMAEFFPKPYPARAAIGVAALPRGAAVEADAVLAVNAEMGILGTSEGAAMAGAAVAPEGLQALEQYLRKKTRMSKTKKKNTGKRDSRSKKYSRQT